MKCIFFLARAPFIYKLYIYLFTAIHNSMGGTLAAIRYVSSIHKGIVERTKDSYVKTQR